MFDVIIRNGSVIDGSGKPAVTADVALRGDRIVDIGQIPATAEANRTVDASGHVVAPGFIDIHTHADIALLARPDHLPKTMQGVTTEVFTNCGLGFAPVTEEGLAIQRKYVAGLFGDDAGVDWNWHTVAEFLAHYEAGGIATNIAYLIPHGSVRVSAMGMEERPATGAELDRMIGLVSQGMEEGAWGLSTGIWYAPMRAADRTELVALCAKAGFFATHQRDYGARIFDATRESLSIAQEASVPVEIAHLQMNGPENAGRAGELLVMLDNARTQGIDVTCDTYPYTAGSTFIQSLLPEWAVDGGPDAIMERLATPNLRDRIMADIRAARSDWAHYNLVGVSSSANLPYEGETFDAIAKSRGLSVEAWICAVLEEDELRGCYVHHAAHEGNVRDIMQWGGQMIGSDGLHLSGKTHPRLYGTFPRVLGRYVRDERVLSLEAAVNKMTGAPAARLGLKGRGLLAVGNAADIVVFDPETVVDTATFDDPLRFPRGIPWVFVNGAEVKAADEPTHALPGLVLRKTDR